MKFYADIRKTQTLDIYRKINATRNNVKQTQKDKYIYFHI